MNNFFDIKSVAVVGASEVEGKIGNSLIKSLEFFEGEKYGVNPKGGESGGIKFFQSIKDLPIIPDILVFAIPAHLVAKSLKESGEKGVKRVIIISAGFKEIGNIKSEQELIDIAGMYDIELLGPNCLGYVDVINKLNLSFGTKTLRACIGGECQNIAMVSQSGAMAVALTDWALSRKMGFSKLISMGNKAGVDENYLLKQLEKDDNTRVISLYLESIDLGAEFFEITKKLSKQKPIVLVKSGISEKGSLVASSHTGALSSEKEVLYTAFRNSGIHFTQSLENFFLWSQIFSKTLVDNIPEELVMITNAGGPGVMATDHAQNYGVKLTEFTDKEKQILKKGLPDSASVNNPIDIIGDATSKTYEKILNNLSKIVKKRAILIILTAQTMTDVEKIAEVIVDFKKQNPDQFILVTFMGGESVEKGREILDKNGILEYDYPKKAIRAYSRLLIQKNWKNTPIEEKEKFELPKNISELKEKLQKEEKFCSNALTQEILESFEINTIKEILVNSEEEVSLAYKKLNANLLVARVSSADIPHKTDVGGIILSIKTEKEAIKAYNDVLKNVAKNASGAFVKGITFSKMAKLGDDSKEVFVGFKRDKSFGNILIVGMGGIYVNVFEDVSRRIGLVSRDEIKKMLKELKVYPLLEGVRGQKGIDIEKVVDIIFKLQYVFMEFEDIKEIDINPIISDDKDSIVVDAKFYL